MSVRTSQKIRILRHPLYVKENLAEVEPDRSERGKYDDTDKGKRSNAGCFLLWTQYREVVLDVIANPEGAVDGCTEEHAATGPAMDVIELLVAIPWS